MDVSTELSARRTGMSFQRTRMSADRTLMSVMRTSLTGIGSSDSAMWDLDGRIGRTNQSLLLDNL